MEAVTKRVPIPRNGVDYRGKIVLAPMVRSGELPSRLLALHYGADLVWGPETVDRSMIGTTRRVNSLLSTVDFTRLPSNGQKVPSEHQTESIIYRIHPALESQRLIFQLGTSDPQRAVAAARLVAADVAGIDVNAGCPKPFSTSGGMGAALLRTPDLLASILEALVKEITPEFEIGISVKIRLLETPEQTEALVRRLCSTGITGLTVHCRTTPMRPREKAIREQLKMIAGICKEAGVACLMNGDVTSRAEALDLVTEFGVDGAMIATAAETNPSCFLPSGVKPWREVVERYIQTALDVENRFGNTKYLLGHMIPGKEAVIRSMMGTKSYVQMCGVLEFTDMIERARAVDEALGLNVVMEGKQGKRKNGGGGGGGQMPKKNKDKPAMAADGNNGKRKRSPGSEEVKPMENFARVVGGQELHQQQAVTVNI